ncbi:AraC family transcriptional regulator [Flammeovirgaceae bacterium SG7u.111]|nr:AraC family transcriptional regulator [Flammeovirgaceae bacterium SG7u.132]WPO38336.1 AraC family transcriptional regulator [Flammeovirgaceae bacterium SG7u.111]
MSSNKKQAQVREYTARINKVFDHIDSNLDKQFTLEELAEVASFSKFHFHRVFFGMVGESPFQFINRVRLERAASLLATNPTKSISEIAIICGFTDLSIFSRNFKSFFGHTPTQWRAKKEESNISQMHSNSRQSAGEVSLYFCNESKTIKWKSTMEQNKSVEVLELPTTHLAYVRHTGPYKGDGKLFESLFNKVYAWAGPRGLMAQHDLKTVVVYHDDPSVTDEDKLRMSVGINVPADTKTEGEIGKMELQPGKHIVARFELGEMEFEQAWGWVFGTWLPQSGYQPADGLCFEVYPEPPRDGKIIVDICVPVKAL